MTSPDADAAFVAAMEDVLETHQEPRDPDRPLVCLDETFKQWVIETREPIPAKPGEPVRHDYEHERNGVADIFMVLAPLECRRHSWSPTLTPPSITSSSSRNYPRPGRIRTRRSEQPMPGSPHSRQSVS